MKACYLLFCICLILLWGAPAFANQAEQTKLLSHQYAYSYHEQEVPIKEVLALPESTWQQVDEFSGHGFKPGEFWLRIHSKNHSNREVKRIIRLGYPLHDYVDVYQFSGDEIISVWHLGDAHVLTSKPINEKNAAFPLVLKSQQQLTTYIRVQGINAMNLSLHILDQKKHDRIQQLSILIAGLVYGILAVMAIYNLGLAVFTSDKTYYVYVAYVVSFTFFALALTGDGFYYLWTQSPVFNAYSIPLFSGIMILPSLFFIFYLLNVKQNAPRLVFPFRLFGVLGFLFVLSVAVLPLTVSIKAINIFSILISLYILGVGIYLFLKGVPVALIYVIAWVIPLMGFAVLSMSALGLIASNTFTQNASIFGGVIETIILSLALAYRIKLERQEKEEAMQSALMAEEQAAASRIMYQELFDRAPVGIFRYTLDGKLTAVNPLFAKMMGFESVEATFNYDDDIRRLFQGGRALAKDVMENKQVIDRQVSLTPLKGEKRECSVSMHVYGGSQGGTVEGYVIDITERKAAEHIREIMEKERMASMEQLVTGVAHEINTPLGTNITSLSYMTELTKGIKAKLEDGSLTVQDFKEYIKDSEKVSQMMTENMKSMSNLVKRFKLVSVKQMNTEIEVINLETHFNELFNNYTNIHPELNIETDTHGIKEIKSYPVAWHIIIDHLIENSIEHGFERDQQRKVIKLEVYFVDNKIVFKYQDNGSGIGEDMKEKIFDPFSTSSRGNKQNAGLGMYRVYNVVNEVLKGEMKLIDGEGFGLIIEMPQRL